MYSLIYPASQPTDQASHLYLLLSVMYLMDTSRLGLSLAWNLDSVANLVCFGKSIKFN